MARTGDGVRRCSAMWPSWEPAAKLILDRRGGSIPTTATAATRTPVVRAQGLSRLSLVDDAASSGLTGWTRYRGNRSAGIPQHPDLAHGVLFRLAATTPP